MHDLHEEMLAVMPQTTESKNELPERMRTIEGGLWKQTVEFMSRNRMTMHTPIDRN